MVATGERRSAVGLLFAPAMAVMSRLTFARKFILLGLLLSGPLAFIVYLQAGSAHERIEFNRRERLGVAYLLPVTEFLHQLQLERLEAGMGSVAALGSIDRRADGAVASIDRMELSAGGLLGTREEWSAIKSAWLELRGRHPLRRAALDAAYHRMENRIVDHLLRRVGNYSNLILDPDLDSYWLMDVLVIKLPSLARTVSRATALSLDPHGAATIAGFALQSQLASDQQRELDGSEEIIEVDIATAFRETSRFGRSPTLERNLRGPVAAVRQAVARHAELLGRRAQGLEVAEGAMQARAGEALARLYELEDAVAPELDRLIAARLDRHRALRTQGLVAAATVALVLTYLLVGIYLSVRSSVSALNKVSPDSAQPRDEIGQMAVAFSRARSEKNQLEEQLRAAEKLATIGTLAAGTAHELNEPLGAILGFAELAGRAQGLPPSAARDLEKISGAALHARDVIRQLLLFARQTPPQKRPLDLQPLVQEALDFLQPRFELAAIELRRSLEQVSPVLGDASQLRQVVLNLAVNALQASRGGGGVEVLLRSEPGQAVLRVCDDGPGMSPEVREQIFVPFFTTKDVGQGTGLGLSVAHGIISSHGGTIEVESGPGQGSRFTVRLPLVE